MQQPDGPIMKRFVAESARIRPELYRYCVRKTGSLADAEDVVQETLAHAYFRLDIYNEDLSMRGWLYAIAKNKCLDHLRRRTLLRHRNTSLDEAEAKASENDDLSDEVLEAFSTSIRVLPPRQRVALLMKDVMGMTAREIAESLNTSEESVRSLLGRARRGLRQAENKAEALEGGELDLMQRYVDSFNARDWDAVSTLLLADATCEVATRFIGHGVDSFRNTYFKRYSMRGDNWFCTLEHVLGDPLVVVWSDSSGRVEPHGMMKIICDIDRVERVVDYSHVEYVSDALREQLSKLGVSRQGPVR